jgi:hypothetical protein
MWCSRACGVPVRGVSLDVTPSCDHLVRSAKALADEETVHPPPSAPATSGKRIALRSQATPLT